jgi:uncharacterized SAM-binding protein YcdF (DUF218 family)
MTLYDSAALKALLLPPGPLVVLAAVGWLLRKRWPAFAPCLLWLGLGLIYVLSTPLIASLLLYGLQLDPALTIDAARRADAIVVVSGDMSANAPEYGGDTVGGLTLQRLRYAAYLQRRTSLPILVTGGRLSPPSEPLATLMARTLTSEFGVPVRWTEDRSQTTYENAVLSADVLRGSGVHTILLVTHAWHMPRAKAAFGAAGFDVIPAPTEFEHIPAEVLPAIVPSANALAMSSYALHELIGLIWYHRVLV